MKGRWALNFIPQRWTLRDKIFAQRAPRRKATLLPAPWVEELMAKRFGALIVCDGCAFKYRDGLGRFGYARHPDMKARGNACDFCKQVQSYPAALWLPEEHRYPTATEHAEQSRHFGIAGAPHLYDARRA